MQQEQCIDNQNTNNEIRAADSSICLEPELIQFVTEEHSVMMEKSQLQQVQKGRSNRPSLTESINSIISNLPSFMNVGPNANQTNITNSKRPSVNPKRPSIQQSKQWQQQQLQIIIDQHWNLNSESLSSEMVSMIQSKIAESSVEGGMESTYNLGNLSIFADSAKIKSMFNIQESKRSQQSGGQEEGGTGISGMKKKTNLDKLELDVIDEISSIWQIENQDSVLHKPEEADEPVKRNGLLEFFSSAPLAIASRFVSKQQKFSEKIKLWNILKKREELQHEKSIVTNEEENDETDRGTGLAESSKTLSIVDEQKQHLSRITSASSDLTVIPQLRNEEELESESNELIHSKKSCGEQKPTQLLNGVSQMAARNDRSSLEFNASSFSGSNTKKEQNEPSQIQIFSKLNNQPINSSFVEILHPKQQTSESKVNTEMPLRKKRSLSVSQADQKLKVPSEQQSKVSSQSKIEQISSSNIKIDKQYRVNNLKTNMKINLAQLNTSKISLDKSRAISIRSHRNSSNHAQLDSNSTVKKGNVNNEKLNSCRDQLSSFLMPSSPFEVNLQVQSAKRAFNNLKKVNLDSSLTSNSPKTSSRLSQNAKQASNLQQQHQLKKNITFKARQIPQLVLQKLVIDCNSIECNSHSQQQSLPISKSPIPLSGRYIKNSSVSNPLAQKQTQISTLSHLYDAISSSCLVSISSHNNQKTEFLTQSQLQQQTKRQDSIENHIFTQRSSYSSYLNDQQFNNKDNSSYSVGRNLNEGSGIFSTKMPSVLDQSHHTARRNKQSNIHQHLNSMISQIPDKQRQHNSSFQGGGSALGGNPVDTLKTVRKAKVESVLQLSKPSSQISTSPTATNKLNSIAVISSFNSKLKNRKNPLRGVQCSLLSDSLDGGSYNLDSIQVRKAQLFDRSNTNH